MSDNKLSETFAKILIGKSIVSGLKQEPEKTYDEIKCLKCKHWQKVPLITLRNPDETKKYPAICDECGNNLDIQEKERKQKKELRKRESSKDRRWFFKFYLITMISFLTLYFIYSMFVDYTVVKYLFNFLGFILALGEHFGFSLITFWKLDFFGLNFIENTYELVGIYESVELLPLWLAWMPIPIFYVLLFLFIYVTLDVLKSYFMMSALKVWFFLFVFLPPFIFWTFYLMILMAEFIGNL